VNAHTFVAKGINMAEMLDCLVSYSSENTNAEGLPRRFLSYLVVASPGPLDGSGIACITPLAAYDENPVCKTCERVLAVKAGGPAAAMDEAVVYLNAYHEGDRLRCVRSEVRSSRIRSDM
jgi:hypothetical protein